MWVGKQSFTLKVKGKLHQCIVLITKLLKRTNKCCNFNGYYSFFFYLDDSKLEIHHREIKYSISNVSNDIFSHPLLVKVTLSL